MNTTKDKVKNALEPKIYIADLLAYNHGILHGEWVDPTKGIEALLDEIARILASSPMYEKYRGEAVEAYAILEYSDFLGADLGKHPDLNKLVDTACLLLKHGRLGAALIGCYSSLQEAITAIPCRLLGRYGSIEEYAYECMESRLGYQSPLLNYFDYEAYALHLRLYGDIFAIERSLGDVYIFRKAAK